MSGETVIADLNYALAGSAPAVFHASAGGEGENRPDGQFVRKSVTIADGRARAASFTLDRSGFATVPHDSAVSDFFDRQEIARIYEPEVARLVCHMTGALRAFVFDHTWRTDSPRIREERAIRDCVPLVHNDYSERSARQRLRDIMPGEEAEALLAARFAIVNVWRSIGGPAETSPLALCDWRSFAEEDLLPMERRARDRVGEMQQAISSPSHKWYYFAHMDRGEVLVFKTFDAADDGRARRSLHSAFDNPAAPAGAPPRVSIESRVFAFFAS